MRRVARRRLRRAPAAVKMAAVKMAALKMGGLGDGHHVSSWLPRLLGASEEASPPELLSLGARVKRGKRHRGRATPAPRGRRFVGVGQRVQSARRRRRRSARRRKHARGGGACTPAATRARGARAMRPLPLVSRYSGRSGGGEGRHSSTGDLLHSRAARGGGLSCPKRRKTHV